MRLLVVEDDVTLGRELKKDGGGDMKLQGALEIRNYLNVSEATLMDMIRDGLPAEKVDGYLTLMVAQVCDLEPGEFVHTFGDLHLYNNHIEQARLQLTRTPYPLPTMRINPEVSSIFDFQYEDFELLDYQSHPHIKAEVSV